MSSHQVYYVRGSERCECHGFPFDQCEAVRRARVDAAMGLQQESPAAAWFLLGVLALFVCMLLFVCVDFASRLQVQP